jgi:hypothetical protein
VQDRTPFAFLPSSFFLLPSSFFLLPFYFLLLTFPKIPLELGVAGLLLAQENKEGDARESSRLEQDCTCRIKIHAEAENPREREVSIPLARNGPRCGFTLTFLGEIMRFENHVSAATPFFGVKREV